MYLPLNHTIFHTAPTPSHPAASIELHNLLGHSHLIVSLHAVKTLLAFLPGQLRVCFHDDGTLTADDAQLLQQHVPGARIIARRTADQLVAQQLQHYPLCQTYRLGQQPHSLFHALKLFDFLLLSSTEQIIALDSDVVFFRQPTEIYELLKHSQGFYWGDEQSVYSFEHDDQVLAHLFPARMLPEVNTGFFYLPERNIYQLKQIESLLRILHCFRYPGPKWIEQTAYALMFSSHPQRFTMLDREAYGIPRFANISPRLKALHFVSLPEVRRHYDWYLKELLFKEHPLFTQLFCREALSPQSVDTSN